jgi:hypothetical protein
MLAFAWRKHATTIVLSALALAGGVYALTVERGSVTTEESEARRKNLLEVWRSEAITELSVTARGKTARLFRGDPDEDGERPWRVEIGGQRYEADPQTVDQYLGSLELGVFERRVPPESVDRATFRLGDPRVAVSLTMDGRARRVVIGGEAPTPPGAAYAEVDGRGVVVITAQLRSALDVDPDAFRARSIAPYLALELAALHLDGEGGSRRIERASWAASRGPAFRFDGSGGFGKARVGQGAVDKLLFALAGLQAEEFLSGEQAAKVPAGRVTLTLIPSDSSKPRAVIEVGAPCPTQEDLVAAVRREPSPLAACVPKSAMDGLVMPAEALVDRRLVAASIDAVSEVKLAAGSDALELARKGSKWHLRAPSDREVEADIGRDFVESLLAVEATSLAPPSAPKMTSPRGRARVISTTESIVTDAGEVDRIEELEIGPEEKGGVVYVRRLEDGALLEVPADRAAVLFPSDLALRSHTIWNEPVKRFRSLTLQEGDRTQRLRRTDDGGWELLEPKGRGLHADIGLATDLADLLGSLKAERWVPATDTPATTTTAKGAFGLDPPRMVIEAEVGDEDAPPDGAGNRRTLRLLLGAPAANGSFARTGDDPAVFIAPKRIEGASGRWLLDRSALVVEPASVIRATLEGAKGSKLVLERGAAGALTIVDTTNKRPSADPALVARAAAIRDAFGDLMAEGAVSVGKPEEAEGFGAKTKPAMTVVIEREGAPDASGKPKRETARIVFGAGDVWRGTNIRYARRDGIEATYAVAQAKVRPLFEALGEGD